VKPEMSANTKEPSVCQCPGHCVDALTLSSTPGTKGVSRDVIKGNYARSVGYLIDGA
jgi:hypothetical protein